MKHIVVFLILIIWTTYAKDLKKVFFEGNEALSSKYIYQNLNLVVEKAWYDFYSSKAPKINKNITESIKLSLENLYKSEGYYHVKVTPTINDKNITFFINENEPILIKDINISVPKEVFDIIKFKKNDIFKVNKFIQIRKNLHIKMKNIGFCNAKVITKAYVDLKKYRVDLVYKIKKNNKCYFGDIEIKTQKDIPKKVILSRLYYKRGDEYSYKKILKSYQTILGLDAFESIDIKDEKYGNIIDTTIITTSKKYRIRKEIGFGYETKYGFKTTMHWEQRNFYGGAKKLSFDFKYSKQEQYIKNSFFIPAILKEPFLKRYIDFKNELTYSKTKYDKFNEDKFQNTLHFLKDTDLISIDAGVSFEKINIKKKVEDSCGVNDGNFILLSPFIKAIIDNRDSKIDPKNGIYLSLYGESGLTYLASSTSYSKVLVEGRAIKTLAGFTIAAKGKLGLIKEFEKKLPESKLFFAGGNFSNRAYSYHSLGAFDSGCDKEGGKTLIDNSLEISHHLYSNYSFALFWDATMISSKENYFNLDFINSYGFGIRYKTLIGPFKLDIGFNSKDHSIYAIHFQIGQSF